MSLTSKVIDPSSLTIQSLSIQNPVAKGIKNLHDNQIMMTLLTLFPKTSEKLHLLVISTKINSEVKTSDISSLTAARALTL